jgi:hypothetical protein
MYLEGYELVELAMVKGVRVTKLRERTSGGLFQMHAFGSEMLEEFDNLSRDLAAVPPQGSRVVKLSKSRSSGYFLTELLPQGIGIRTWIRRLRDTRAAQPQRPAAGREPAPAPAASSAPAGGEMANVYRLANRLKTKTQPAADACIAGPGAPAETPPPARTAPGFRTAPPDYVPEPALPMPSARRLDARSRPGPVSVPRTPVPAPPPPAGAIRGAPLDLSPPPKTGRPERPGLDWRIIAWTAGGLVAALAIVLWILEMVD